MTNTLKRAGHAMLGAPSSLASTVRERISDIRASLDDVGADMGDRARAEFDEWAAEGERLVSRLLDTVGSWRSKTEQSADTARDTVRGIAATATEPVVEIDEINGIGPSYAKRLRAAGVTTTSALLERCETKEGLERLAEQADVSPNLLEAWVAEADLTRIDGIGTETMGALASIGVGTLEMLAESDPVELHERFRALAEEDWDGPVPSETTLAEWRRAAELLDRRTNA